MIIVKMSLIYSIFVIVCELHFLLCGPLTLKTNSSEDECPAPRFRSDYELVEDAEGWLKLHRVPAVWSDARLRCHAEGGQLASPLTAAMQRALGEFLQRRAPAAPLVYCGVHATYSAGDYASVEGVPLRSLALQWAEGEPDNRHNAERCVALQPRHNASGTAAAARDVRCARALPYLCYKRLDAALPPVNECGTTDPEYMLAVMTNTCYKFHRRGLSWARAYMTCAAEGGALAVPNGALEAALLRGLFSKNPEHTIDSPHTSYALVGIRNNNDGGSWMTIHGETLAQAGYSQWAEGSPNDGAVGGDRCGGFHRAGGYVDLPCAPEDHHRYAFICEKSPRSLTEPDELCMPNRRR